MRVERSIPTIRRTDDRSHIFAPGERRLAIPPRPSMTMNVSRVSATDMRQFGADTIAVMSALR